MGRKTTLKWDRSTLCKPNHNIISSDFPKYVPQQWKFMDGRERIEYIMSNEYQRMWSREVVAWKKRMYPDNTTEKVDVVKNYVLSFKKKEKAEKPSPEPHKSKAHKKEE